MFILGNLDNDLKSKSQVDICVPLLYTIFLVLFMGQGIFQCFVMNLACLSFLFASLYLLHNLYFSSSTINGKSC